MNKLTALLMMTTAARFVPFDDDVKPGWKMTEDGKGIAIGADGNPIYVKADKSEATIEAGTISRLNNEAKTLRERAEGAEAKVKVFEGIDPTKAREAIEVVGKLDQKKLIDAGKVDELKAQITGVYEGQIKERDTKLGELSNRLAETKLGYAFSGSKVVKEKLIIPHDIAQATFGKFFKVGDDGKMTAVGFDGNPVYSKTRIGELADFDEALETIVAAYPNRDAILRGGNQTGTGNGGGGGNQRPGTTTKTREAFNTLPPMEQAAFMKEVREGKAQLTDA